VRATAIRVKSRARVRDGLAGFVPEAQSLSLDSRIAVAKSRGSRGMSRAVADVMLAPACAVLLVVLASLIALVDVGVAGAIVAGLLATPLVAVLELREGG
jgi:hypothetical protein